MSNYKKIIYIVGVKVLAVSIFSHLIFAFYYYYNSSSFNDFLIFSYGSDSAAFQLVLSDFLSNGADGQLFSTYFDEGKIVHILLYYPYSYFFGINLYSSFFIVLQNLVLYFASAFLIIGNFRISNKHEFFPLTDVSYFLAVVALFFPISYFVPVSFLRDTLVLFVLVYVVFFTNSFLNKPSIINASFLLFLAVILFNLRSFYVYIYLFSVFLFCLVELWSRKKIFYLLFLLFVFSVLSLFFFEDVVMGSFRRLLMLSEDDLAALDGADSLIVSESELYSGEIDILNLAAIFFERLVLGSAKFLITPIFTSYITVFFDSKQYNFYKGFEIDLLEVTAAFLYNFFILPLFVGALWEFLIKLRRNLYITDVVTLSICFSTVLVYGVKFLGGRNSKVDLIYQLFALIFIQAKGFNYRVSLFVIIFMVFINVAYALSFVRGLV